VKVVAGIRGLRSQSTNSIGVNRCHCKALLSIASRLIKTIVYIWRAPEPSARRGDSFKLQPNYIGQETPMPCSNG
jgi:hypothetical protein